LAPVPDLTERDVARFWSYLEDEDRSGCWQWRRTRRNSYASFAIRGHTYPAHRVSWTLRYGAIPDGLNVCHHCDNPRCVRPDHLFLGTDKDNQVDCERKGRRRHAKGEGHGKATLTESLVVEARRRYRAGETQAKIAADLGVGIRAISTAIVGDTWAHVEEPPVPKRKYTKKQPSANRGSFGGVGYPNRGAIRASGFAPQTSADATSPALYPEVGCPGA